MSGKSDFSSFLHETFHDWSRTLSEEHVVALERAFGKRGTVAFEESAARAFERYMRDGQAPSGELGRVFASIRTLMIKVYASVKGTELEKRITPEVRRVFDEMLSPKTTNARR